MRSRIAQGRCTPPDPRSTARSGRGWWPDPAGVLLTPGENYWNGGRRDLKVGANPLPSIDGYDTVLLASPIWNITAPMIMSRFAESYDFSGKTVHPVTTHAMSGLGTTREDYARQCRGARIGTGYAIRGEDVRSAGTAVDAWLRRARLLDDSDARA